MYKIRASTQASCLLEVIRGLAWEGEPDVDENGSGHLPGVERGCVRII